jgi:hypothetical protein
VCSQLIITRGEAFQTGQVRFHIVAQARQGLAQLGVFFAFGFGNGIELVSQFFENAPVGCQELLGGATGRLAPLVALGKLIRATFESIEAASGQLKEHLRSLVNFLSFADAFDFLLVEYIAALLCQRQARANREKDDQKQQIQQRGAGQSWSSRSHSRLWLLGRWITGLEEFAAKVGIEGFSANALGTVERLTGAALVPFGNTTEHPLQYRYMLAKCGFQLT